MAYRSARMASLSNYPLLLARHHNIPTLHFLIQFRFPLICPQYKKIIIVEQSKNYRHETAQFNTHTRVLSGGTSSSGKNEVDRPPFLSYFVIRGLCQNGHQFKIMLVAPFVSVHGKLHNRFGFLNGSTQTEIASSCTIRFALNDTA